MDESPPLPLELIRAEVLNYRRLGLAIAFGVFAAWLGTLAYALFGLRTLQNLALDVALVAALTCLYTGLFITAHDAMHRSLAPGNARLNDAVGAVAVALFAMFSYRTLAAPHLEHHAHPASSRDPDYHDGARPGFASWYLHFVLRYVSLAQIARIAAVFFALLFVFAAPLSHLLLFWVLPPCLSTFQLFYFGTYLPHREPEHGYDNEHRARSNDFGVVLSWITCYHFGYHLEHHLYPYAPWWKLPRVRGFVFKKKT